MVGGGSQNNAMELIEIGASLMEEGDGGDDGAGVDEEFERGFVVADLDRNVEDGDEIGAQGRGGRAGVVDGDNRDEISWEVAVANLQNVRTREEENNEGEDGGHDDGGELEDGGGVDDVGVFYHVTIIYRWLVRLTMMEGCDFV